VSKHETAAEAANSLELSARVAEFTPRQLLDVEEFGRVFEQTGLAPMPARLFALLLIADPPYMEFFAIKEALQASKSAISNAIKELHEQKQLLSYRTFPGDRKRYFYVDFDKWHAAARKAVAATTKIETLLEQVKSKRPAGQVEFSRKLDNMIGFYQHLDEGLKKLMTEWTSKQAAKLKN